MQQIFSKSKNEQFKVSYKKNISQENCEIYSPEKLIRCVNDLESIISTNTRVITLFSGGLDSAYLLYLLHKYGCKNITALTVDLGDDLDVSGIEAIAKKFGANSVVLDRKVLFAERAVIPSIKAQSCYLGVHPISASLSRPIIAQEAITYAKKIGAEVILHTANQSQNSLRRLNGALRQLNFKGFFGTPYEFSAITRENKINDLKTAAIDNFKKRLHSGDSNLWCREFESGSLENPEQFYVPDFLYRWSASTPKPELQKTSISITFIEGVPHKVNRKFFPIVDLINYLNTSVGEYGLGRYSGLEELPGGEKVLEVREMPAAHILLNAYRHLETATVNYETIREKINVEQLWIREAIEGRWFGALKESTQQFISNVAKKVTGTVTYNLDWRSLELTSIVAEKPLYITDRDAWEINAASSGLLTYQRRS